MRRLVLIFAVLFFSTFAYSQIGFGLKAGVNMSTFSTNINDVEKAFNAGWQGGAFVRIGDKWHIQPEVYFTLKQGELTYDLMDVAGGSTQSVKQNIKLNTIDIPVLVGWKIIDPPLFNIRLQAGPVASIVSSTSFDITVDGAEFPPTDEFKESFNDVNWGLQFGAGVDVLVFTIDLRYEMGLNDLNKEVEMVGSGNNPTFKNNLIFLSVGWKIM
jgi:hypothetical protein